MHRHGNTILSYPTVYDGRDRIVLYPGIGQISEVPRFSNRSFSITADVILPAKGTEGVLFSSGGRSGGISLFVQNNKPQFVYNLGDEKITITSSRPISAGKAQLKFDFVYDNAKKSGGTGALYINNDKVGEAHLERSVFRSVEGLTVGKDIITPVNDSYKVPFEFTGKLEKVTIDLK
jgi:hypothetical protein